MRAYDTQAEAGTFNSPGGARCSMPKTWACSSAWTPARVLITAMGSPRPGRRSSTSNCPQRAEAAGRLRQTDREIRHRPGDRGPARLHRRSPAGRGTGRGLQGRLPARPGDAPDHLYPGEAKTDARDAAVIADAARTLPHALRSLELTDEITAELTFLTGFDQDLAAEATCTSNRIRDTGHLKWISDAPWLPHCLRHRPRPPPRLGPGGGDHDWAATLGVSRSSASSHWKRSAPPPALGRWGS